MVTDHCSLCGVREKLESSLESATCSPHILQKARLGNEKKLSPVDSKVTILDMLTLGNSTKSLRGLMAIT